MKKLKIALITSLVLVSMSNSNIAKADEKVEINYSGNKIEQVVEKSTSMNKKKTSTGWVNNGGKWYFINND